MLKRSSLINSALLAAALASACSASFAATSAPNGFSFGSCKLTGKPSSVTLATQEADTLTVGTVLPNPGWWNGISPTAVDSGFEYCLAANVAYRAGLHHVKIKNMAWDQFISGTATNYDIALATITITDARKRVFTFSRPYFSSNLGVATTGSSDVSEANLRGKRVGVLQGNAGSDWVNHVLKPRSVAVYQSQPDMFTALIAGQVDAVITDTTLALAQAKTSNAMVRVVAQFKIDQGYGAITPPGSPNSKTIDSIVGEFSQDGTLKELSAAYLQPKFGVDPASVPFWSVK
ncbi:ABC transporter substrate-binding protein (plasmid) [Ralstonia sp. 25C]|uniref:ABC transporter substrate-binding protein n=1 Tax=Ralstonia sp. 25C TaxID=3447363 RepID=UPI003F756C3A